MTDTRHLIAQKYQDLSSIRRDMKGISPKLSLYAKLQGDAKVLLRDISILEGKSKRRKTISV